MVILQLLLWNPGNVCLPNTLIMKLFSLLTLLLGLFTQTVLPIEAAVAPFAKEGMVKGAALIIEGTVLSVSSKTQKSKIEKGGLIARDRIYTIQVKIKKVEKGKVKVGDEITVSAWKPSTRIPPLPGPQGHESIPGKGDLVKMYLLGDPKTYEPYMPNGISILQKEESKKTK